MGCCGSSPPAADEDERQPRRRADSFSAEDDTFYDCLDDGGGDMDAVDAVDADWREGGAAGTTSPVSQWPDVTLPCEPLDDDDEVPPLPPGVEVSEDERQAALRAMRAKVMAAWDTGALPLSR
jgi:hypothetical protein